MVMFNNFTKFYEYCSNNFEKLNSNILNIIIGLYINHRYIDVINSCIWVLVDGNISIDNISINKISIDNIELILKTKSDKTVNIKISEFKINLIETNLSNDNHKITETKYGNIDEQLEALYYIYLS